MDTLYERKPLLKGWIRALLIIGPWLVIGGVFYLLEDFFFNNLFPDVLPDSMNLTASQGFALLATLLIVGIFTRYIDRASFLSIGFAVKIRDIVFGVLLGFVLIGLGFVILLMLGQIEVTGINFSISNLLISTFLFILIAFNEEIFLRGYILNNLMQSMNKYVALIISSIFFASLHAFNPDFGVMPFINLFLVGIFLGMSYIFTRNLSFPVALHFSWNFGQAIFGFEVSGNKDIYFLIEILREKDNIINGGGFGFEGSLVSLLILIVAITSLLKIPKRVG